MKEGIIIFGIVMFCLIFFASVSYVVLIKDNIHEIVGIKCARNLRITVDYPFCSTVLDCMEDCATIKGGFVEVKTVGGIGREDRCFCYTKDGIENIW